MGCFEAIHGTGYSLFSREQKQWYDLSYPTDGLQHLQFE
jgi:hypothetical protein